MTADVERVQDAADAERAGTGNGAADGAIAVYDPAAAAVLTALEHGAREHLGRIRPKKTQDGYARDWALWEEFHGWLAERTGTRLPLSALTVGTFVGFVTWLDQVQQAAPNTIERRITGVTVEARGRGFTVPKEASRAAREALKRPWGTSVQPLALRLIMGSSCGSPCSGGAGPGDGRGGRSPRG
ncbi:hypothetical protein [Streptomyces sp. NPDC001292]|uniref:hypothetical protein n=1 Tax=Streptomyces sp. NPDC001292 TaxID=3364558 RepID=UPI00368D1F3A